MKFLWGTTNSRWINTLFKTQKPLKIAVAFWGNESVNLFKSIKKETKVICNLPSGGTNPYAIESIKNKIGSRKIKSCSNLHAKVYWCPDFSIIGSSNVSANGLALEDGELDGWIEASVLISNKNVNKNIQEWFDDLWQNKDQCKFITNEDLKKAKQLWKERRKGRPIIKRGRGKSLLNLLKENPGVFKDGRYSNVYLALYSDHASKAAKRTFLKFKKAAKYKKPKNENLSIENMNYYQNWEDLPDDSYLLDLYRGKGKNVYGAIFKTPNIPVILKFKDVDGSKSNIKICEHRKSIDKYKIAAKDTNLLEKKIPEFWKRLKEEDGVISLYDARKILFSSK